MQAKARAKSAFSSQKTRKAQEAAGRATGNAEKIASVKREAIEWSQKYNVSYGGATRSPQERSLVSVNVNAYLAEKEAAIVAKYDVSWQPKNWICFLCLSFPARVRHLDAFTVGGRDQDYVADSRFLGKRQRAEERVSADQQEKQQFNGKKSGQSATVTHVFQRTEQADVEVQSKKMLLLRQKHEANETLLISLQSRLGRAPTDEIGAKITKCEEKIESLLEEMAEM